MSTSEQPTAPQTHPEENGTLKDIVAHAKKYGFVFQSGEIYDGLQAVYDYGPYGVELKNNIKRLWWDTMTRLHNNIVGIDAAIFMPPTVWKASGHVDSFNDPMIDNKDSNKRYRADVLIEEKAAEYEYSGNAAKAQSLLKEAGKLLEKEDFDTLRALIIEENITCPISGTANWTEIRQFNLMFSTKVGAVSGEADTIYLRPETAQGIFVNFLNVQKSARMNVPFGIAQIGKAFRNEIVARQFIFRMREFEQMEMQFFVRPGQEMKWYEHWKETRMKWYNAVGFPTDKFRFHDHEKLAHYANAAADIEYRFPFGFKEIEGIHSRTDFDLSQHQEFSKKKHNYFDNEINKNYIPYVVETSAGADRLFLMMLSEAYTVQKISDGEREKTRTYLKFPAPLAPVKAAVMPIVRKDGLADIAQTVFDQLKTDFNVIYEDRGSIGKLYTRQDLIGTPFCIAIDYETKDDESVTVRHRDTTDQKRVKISALNDVISKEISFKQIFEKL